jgi:hypothetical protein
LISDVLRTFISATKQNDNLVAALNVVNSVSRTVMYPHLANAVANRGNVAGIAKAETIDSGQHLRASSNVAQIPEPF